MTGKAGFNRLCEVQKSDVKKILCMAKGTGRGQRQRNRDPKVQIGVGFLKQQLREFCSLTFYITYGNLYCCKAATSSQPVMSLPLHGKDLLRSGRVIPSCK